MKLYPTAMLCLLFVVAVTLVSCQKQQPPTEEQAAGESEQQPAVPAETVAETAQEAVEHAEQVTEKAAQEGEEMAESAAAEAAETAEEAKEETKQAHETVMEKREETVEQVTAIEEVDFTLMDQNGKPVHLAGHMGKIVVLEWVNPDCPFVQRHYEAGTMKRLAEKYQPEGVVWMAINSTNYMDREDNREWVDQYDLPYPILDDHTGEVGKTFGAKTTPQMFIFDESGQLGYQGAIDDDPRGNKAEATNYIAQVLEALLAGEEPPVKETRPYGCSVKYAE